MTVLLQVADPCRTGGERLTDRNRGGRWSKTGTRGLPLGSDVPSPASAALVSLLAASCMRIRLEFISYSILRYDLFKCCFVVSLCFSCSMINIPLLCVNGHRATHDVRQQLQLNCQRHA